MTMYLYFQINTKPNVSKNNTKNPSWLISLGGWAGVWAAAPLAVVADPAWQPAWALRSLRLEHLQQTLYPALYPKKWLV
jgi:hypothetical protein